MVLGVPYSLYLYRWVMFGKLVKPTLSAIQDLTRLEIAVFVPLMVATLWMGIYPASFSRLWAATATQMIARYQAAPTAAVASNSDVRSKGASTE
jgi:NADH-quinone oxidoreductase subunit M